MLQFARQIQQAVANGAAPAVSLTIRNLNAHLSRNIVPRGLDPHIPAFQINGKGKGVTEKHADNVAYESLNASGNVALPATPAYHYESFPDNRRINDSSDKVCICVNSGKIQMLKYHEGMIEKNRDA
jgi:hypothetical protein